MTAVEWLEHIYLTTGLNRNVHFNQAKIMEKQQIIDAWNDVYGHIKDADEYYTSTYGSKGSDDHIADTNKMVSSQTEISDEEYYKDIFYQKQVMNPYLTEEQSYTAYEQGFMDCAKWYREQLKQK